MTGEQYQEKLLTILVAARTISDVDVPDLLQRINRADTLGALLDPTLYRKKHGAMMEDKELLEAALPLWRAGKALEERARARARATGKVVDA
jgi:hypothetical protein